MKSINPANETIIKEYPAEDFSRVRAKLSALQTTFFTWKTTALEQRLEVIRNVREQLIANKEEYAYIITSEMGKITKQAVQEVEKCAVACNYYIENAKAFLAPKIIQTEAHKSYVTYAPLGIILGIMPWNFPFWQVFRFAIPTLLTGNVIILKHASSVPGCALTIESIFTTAAEDLNLEPFKSILVSGDQIGEIITEPLIQAVTLTGSIAAGKSVASIAGAHIKKTVLELGGNDPYIVLADADLDQAVLACATGRLNNCGQSCVAAKRLIVVADIYDAFLEKLTTHFAHLKIGDPTLDNTDIGPLSSKQALDTVIDQVAKTMAAGANCYFGGDRLDKDGYYFQPTILTDIPRDSPGYNDEIFGPVACVFKVANEQEAIALANEGIFGLGAAIFSKNIAHAAQMAEDQVNAGMVFVNSYVASDPRLPFGGIKQSGYGRELSEFGIHEFVNIKTISIQT